MSYEEYQEKLRKIVKERQEARSTKAQAERTLEVTERKMKILDIQYEFENASSSNDVEEMSYELAQEYNKSVLFEEGMAEGFEKGFEKGYQMAFEKALEIVKENI